MIFDDRRFHLFRLSLKILAEQNKTTKQTLIENSRSCNEMDQSFVKADNNDPPMNVRFVQQIKIRIGEAKNLQPKNGANSLKDCFCVISLDREEIFRTHNSIDKTLSPFFGEEFCFDIPREFRYLSIHVYERERTMNNLRNRPLGKVTIGKDHLRNLDAEESWFPLMPANHSPEIYGKIHLQIKPQFILNINALVILVNIFECQNIADENCDSYIDLNMKIYGKIFKQKSKIKRKTINPQFNESFRFEFPLDKYSENITSNSQFILDDLLDNLRLKLSVCECSSKSKKHLGDITIPLSKMQINSTHNAWYYLQPQTSSTLKSNHNHNHRSQTNCDCNLGSLRLRVNYISDYVFSSQFYDSLRNLLLSSTETKPITSSVAYLLGEFVLNKADAAQPLVKFFLHYKKIVLLIKYLAEDEISKVSDVNIIFRGNSLVSKLIDELMKLVGIRYLHDTLKDCVETVINENECCEIDSTRNKDNEMIQANMNKLKNYTALFFNAIIRSVQRCPPIMCEVFNVLKELAIQFFPDNKDVCYYVISGFVFLRFFAPSILNPRLFELTDKKISFQVNRTFTLISKTIQSIGNLVVSKKTLIKENYMMTFYREFITDYHVSSTKDFLESISSYCPQSTKDVQEPVILKESIMFKKSKRIGFRPTFKKRYFCLTTQHLSYAKAKNKAPLNKLPISEITVMRKTTAASPESYPIKHMFQVIHNKCTLQIRANNCVQEREWLDTMNRLIQLNQMMMMTMTTAPHSNQTSNNNNNKIQSFNNNNENNSKNSNTNITNTCTSSISSGNNIKCHLSFDLSIKLDPDRELARIHSLLVSNLENIQSIIIDGAINENTICSANMMTKTTNPTACSVSVKIWKGHGHNYLSQFVIEDRQTLLPTLIKLKDCICHLEQNQKQYLSQIIGSEMAPIVIIDADQ